MSRRLGDRESGDIGTRQVAAEVVEGLGCVFGEQVMSSLLAPLAGGDEQSGE